MSIIFLIISINILLTEFSFALVDTLTFFFRLVLSFCFFKKKIYAYD